MGSDNNRKPALQLWNKDRYKAFIPAISASILLLILGQVLSPGFASIGNIVMILSMATILAIASIGQTLVVIGGKEGIDLSVGALLSMGALLGAQLSQGMNDRIGLAVIVLAALGVAIGVIHAAAIQLLDIPPLVMTLGMASVINGLTLLITKGQPAGGAPEALIRLGIGKWQGIPYLLMLGIVLVLAMQWLLGRSSYGRTLFLIGSNRRAAVLSGIRVNRYIFLTYIFAGVAGTLGGLVLLGYAGSSQLGMGESYTLLSIAAVVIGGTSLAGGAGSYTGSALGAIVLVLLTSVLVAVGMPAGVRELIQGVILLLILIAYSRAPKLRQ